MKAAQIQAYGEPLVIREIPTPQPGPGEVLVRVKGSGFCHSDLHVISGELPILPHMPMTLGHENAGVVAEVGEGVTAVEPGDPVAVYGGWGCGFCDMCITGREQMCLTPSWVGLSRYDGGYAEYLLVPQERYLVKLDKLDPAVAAPLTDAALTPYRAIKRALPFIEPDYPVLVIGAGGLGQFGIKLLKLLTGSKIIVMDIAEDKLQIAKEYGADHLVDGRDPDVRDRILEVARGIGVSAAFDFVGSDETLQIALHATRPEGKVTQVGLAGGEIRFKLFTDMPFEVTVEGTLWGTIKELREVIALAETRMLTPIELEFEPLDRINDVYEALRLGKVQGRAVITP
jgi:propanol-preferring alcohol dehydrogenase